jgi:hypothetical protein
MERLREGRDYDPEFGVPEVRQEFCAVNPGNPWYMDVNISDLPAVFHCIRTALSWADNPLHMDMPSAQRIPKPGELKVRWSLAPDVDKGEYVIAFTYLWPVRVCIRDEAIMAHYCPTAINWDMTGWVLDDIHPRRYMVHVYQLPYPPVDIMRSKSFHWWPTPTLHLTGPVVGVERDDMIRPGRKVVKGKKKTWGQALTGLLPFVGGSPTVDAMDEESDEDESSEVRRRNKKTGEPATKKRKLAERDE